MKKAISLTLPLYCSMQKACGQLIAAENNPPAKNSAPPPKQEKYVARLNTTLNTDVVIERGNRVDFSAEGVISFGFFAGEGGPEGINFGTLYNYFDQYKHGALIGRIGNGNWFRIGQGGYLVSSSTGLLQLGVNDNKSGDNTGHFTVKITVTKSVPLKTPQQRYEELQKVRKNGDPDELARWFDENKDWTKGLPELPPNVAEARRQNNLAKLRGEPEPWHIGPMTDASKKYHPGGETEIRQMHNLPGHLPGVGVQGIYNDDPRFGGDLIPNEGTPDLASPRDMSLGNPDSWVDNYSVWREHMRTDVDFFDHLVETLGPLEGEKKYREYYNTPLPDRMRTPEARQAQGDWEKARAERRGTTK